MFGGSSHRQSQPHVNRFSNVHPDGKPNSSAYRIPFAKSFSHSVSDTCAPPES